MTLPQKGYLLSCFGLLVCISAVFLMEGRYYQDNVYHGMNLFFAILWILSGIFGLLCLVYMIRCVVKKRWRVRDLVLGCLPVAATCLLLWGQEECGSDDADRSLFCPVPRDYLVFVLIR